jgi:hypothetical protein
MAAFFYSPNASEYSLKIRSLRLAKRIFGIKKNTMFARPGVSVNYRVSREENSSLNFSASLIMSVILIDGMSDGAPEMMDFESCNRSATVL